MLVCSPTIWEENKAHVPSEWGKRHVQKIVSMASALCTKYFLLRTTLKENKKPTKVPPGGNRTTCRKNKTKQKNPLPHHYLCGLDTYNCIL